MASPASAHAEAMHEEEMERRQKWLTRVGQGLGDIARGPGFGPKSDDSLWEDREIRSHLEAAYRLVQLSTRRASQ